VAAADFFRGLPQRVLGRREAVNGGPFATSHSGTGYAFLEFNEHASRAGKEPPMLVHLDGDGIDRVAISW